MTITYALEPDLGPEEFIDILVRSTLSERRPIDDRPTISGMLFAKSSERSVSFRWIRSEHTIQTRWVADECRYRCRQALTIRTVWPGLKGHVSYEFSLILHGAPKTGTVVAHESDQRPPSTVMSFEWQEGKRWLERLGTNAVTFTNAQPNFSGL